MRIRRLGKTSLTVSALGLGGGPLGDFAIDDETAERLIRGALDLGVNVIDTAPSYAASETRIGNVLRAMPARERDKLVLVTKGGYGVPGVEDWTPEVLSRGIDRALERLATDRIDVFLLHSCPKSRLERGDLLAPLEQAKRAGKIRAFGYSGDGEALAWAVRCDAFDVVECSVSFLDQEATTDALPAAIARNVGVLGKRSMAGAPWEIRSGDNKSAYEDRWRAAYVDAAIAEVPPEELAIRFAAYAAGVSSALMGTRQLDRVRRAAGHVERGPLPAPILAEVARRFAGHGGGGRWPGVV